MSALKTLFFLHIETWCIFIINLLILPYLSNWMPCYYTTDDDTSLIRKSAFFKLCLLSPFWSDQLLIYISFRYRLSLNSIVLLFNKISFNQIWCMLCILQFYVYRTSIYTNCKEDIKQITYQSTDQMYYQKSCIYKAGWGYIGILIWSY